MAELDDDNLPVVDLEDEKLPVVKLKTVNKIARPKKTPTIAPKQEFYTPLPPDPFAPKSTFHFETTPYNQPQEERRQRLIRLRDPNTKFVRASTPEEKQQLADVEKEQEAYEKYDPRLYSLRESFTR